jgi:hypothetical protein
MEKPLISASIASTFAAPNHIRRVLGALLFVVTGSAWSAGWYIPSTQIIIEPCRKAALAEHPGKVVRTHVNGTERAMKVRFYIEQNDGREWLVYCDAATDRIVKSVSVDDLFQP